jgi:hypothetical protein
VRPGLERIAAVLKAKVNALFGHMRAGRRHAPPLAGRPKTVALPPGWPDLWNWRAALGWSRKGLAAQAGMELANLRRLELGAPIDVSERRLMVNLRALARVLKRKIAEVATPDLLRACRTARSERARAKKTVRRGALSRSLSLTERRAATSYGRAALAVFGGDAGSDTGAPCIDLAYGCADDCVVSLPVACPVSLKAEGLEATPLSPPLPPPARASARSRGSAVLGIWRDDRGPGIAPRSPRQTPPPRNDPAGSCLAARVHAPRSAAPALPLDGPGARPRTNRGAGA